MINAEDLDVLLYVVEEAISRRDKRGQHRYGKYDVEFLRGLTHAIRGRLKRHVDQEEMRAAADRAFGHQHGHGPSTYRVIADLHEQASGHRCAHGCDSRFPVNCNCQGTCPKHNACPTCLVVGEWPCLGMRGGREHPKRTLQRTKLEALEPAHG